jgi:hypothetical protein
LPWRLDGVGFEPEAVVEDAEDQEDFPGVDEQCPEGVRFQFSSGAGAPTERAETEGDCSKVVSLFRSVGAGPRLGAALPFQPGPCKAGDTEICSGVPQRKLNLGQVQQFCVIFLTGKRPRIGRRPPALQITLTCRKKPKRIAAGASNSASLGNETEIDQERKESDRGAEQEGSGCQRGNDNPEARATVSPDMRCNQGGITDMNRRFAAVWLNQKQD